MSVKRQSITKASLRDSRSRVPRTPQSSEIYLTPPEAGGAQEAGHAALSAEPVSSSPENPVFHPDFPRSAGVLLPLFSLPSAYGIGSMGAPAREFIDCLASAEQSWWQILPINPVGGWDSPYQPRSCYAGERLYIDPEALLAQGLITEEELRAHASLTKAGSPVLPSDAAEIDEGVSAIFEKSELPPENAVDYSTVRLAMDRLLRTAYQRFRPDSEYENFLAENRAWLKDYARFEALAVEYGTVQWYLWPEADRLHESTQSQFAGANVTCSNAGATDCNSQNITNGAGAVGSDVASGSDVDKETEFQKWVQFEFFREWKALIGYAHEKGVCLIGDVPIYAALESADCWANRALFQLNEDCRPESISGAPPDDFNPRGQTWGNPLYDWEGMKADGYDWWVRRLRHNMQMFDAVRLDHMRGFESYFSIPAETGNAAEGHWEPGPGIDFFRAVHSALGSIQLIAEDLGDITPEVEEMVRATGLPEMKVLQFGFDTNESNPYLPRNIGANSVVYTGTHDNDTTRGWYRSLDFAGKRRVTAFIRKSYGILQSEKVPYLGSKEVDDLLIEMALHCRSRLCIIPLQDWLRLKSEARVNHPGTVGASWMWRMTPGMLNRPVCARMADETQRTGRGRTNRR